MAGPTVPLLALAGGAGSGKSTIARELAQVPGVAVVHLDDCYHTDPRLAPAVPAFDGRGRVVDFSDPRSIDPARVTAALDRPPTPALLVVEGIFALALGCVRDAATWAVYVEAPADIRLARKTLRRIEQGRPVGHALRGYLERGRAAHNRHVAPSRIHADLVVDGTDPIPDQIKQIRRLLSRGRTAR